MIPIDKTFSVLSRLCFWRGSKATEFVCALNYNSCSYSCYIDMDQRFSESLLHSFYLNTNKQWAAVQNGMCDDKRLLVDTFEPECSIKCFHKQTLALIELSDIKILDSTPCTFTYLVAFILWIRSRTTDQGTAGMSTYNIFICCNDKKQKHT